MAVRGTHTGMIRWTYKQIEHSHLMITIMDGWMDASDGRVNCWIQQQGKSVRKRRLPASRLGKDRLIDQKEAALAIVSAPLQRGGLRRQLTSPSSKGEMEGDWLAMADAPLAVNWPTGELFPVQPLTSVIIPDQPAATKKTSLVSEMTPHKASGYRYCKSRWAGNQFRG